MKLGSIPYWCLCTVFVYLTMTEVAVSRHIRHWRFKTQPVNLVEDINVEGFLKQFGYMDEIPAGIVDDSLRDIDDRDKQISQALTKFQYFYGLRQTGEPDRETIKWMKTPRCGVADSTSTFRRKRSMDPLEFTLLGKKWGKSRLTWKLSRPTFKLRTDDQRRTIQSAFNIWEKVAPLTFTETTGEPDLEILFARGEHGDGQGNAFDGRSNVLAHAFGPGEAAISGDAHFDDDEDWTLEADRGSDLLVVAAHEFGHSLGLGHSRDQDALMFPAYQSQDDLKLGYDDIRALQTLYGSRISPETRYTVEVPRRTQAPYRPPTTPAPTTTPAPPEPCNVDFDAMVEGKDRFYYAIRQGSVYKFQEDGLEPDYPKPVAEVFEGAPSQIDLAFSIARTSKIYIIKDDMVWRYTDMELDEDFPLQFNRQHFNEAPRFVMSLTDDRGLSRVILFGERQWWFYNFDVLQQSVPMKYDISSNWRGVPPNVKYSIRWSDNNYYLVTSDSHVVFDHNRRTASNDGLVSGLPPWLDRTCAAINENNSGHLQQPLVLFTMATVIITWILI